MPELLNKVDMTTSRIRGPMRVRPIRRLLKKGVHEACGGIICTHAGWVTGILFSAVVVCTILIAQPATSLSSNIKVHCFSGRLS